MLSYIPSAVIWPLGSICRTAALLGSVVVLPLAISQERTTVRLPFPLGLLVVDGNSRLKGLPALTSPSILVLGVGCIDEVLLDGMNVGDD